MYSLRRFSLFCTAFLFTSSAFLIDANAQSRRGGGGASAALSNGSSSLGFGFIYTSTDQSDLNGVIDDNNRVVAGGISTKNFSGAYELYANWAYRFDRTSYAFVVRPSYMWQETTGSGSGGAFNFRLTGYTLFPMFRMYPLENDFIKFYMQGGLGYGSLSGDITAGAYSLQFQGSAFGAIGGVGVNFCFTETHCLNIEGNLRYLPIERNKSTGGNCTSGNISGITQCGNSQEVERGAQDLATSMSGVQGLIGYTVNF